MDEGERGEEVEKNPSVSRPCSTSSGRPERFMRARSACLLRSVWRFLWFTSVSVGAMMMMMV